jgi:hypothetical protein
MAEKLGTDVVKDHNDTYRWIAVRDCQAFLWAMYVAYKGLAFASFEGKLLSLRLHEIPGASNCAMAPLTRETDAPTLDYWVVPINEETINALKARLSHSGILGEDGVVVHTQLGTEEQLIFSACDNFDKDCVRVSTSVPQSLFEELLHKGVLKQI